MFMLAGVAAVAVLTQTRGECGSADVLLPLGTGLSHSRAALTRRHALEVVALGSSSMAGDGVAVPFPQCLQESLSHALPGAHVSVHHAGRSGDDVRAMQQRLEADVLSAHPDLVIWQVGTNSLLEGRSIADQAASLLSGLEHLREGGADVILMDLQYAPRVLREARLSEELALIAEVSVSNRAGLFRRFEVMRAWHQGDPHFERFVQPDGLHPSELAAQCLGQTLATEIVASIQSPNSAADLSSPPSAPAAQKANPSR